MILDIQEKKKIQEDIYKCSQLELKKIIELLVNYNYNYKSDNLDLSKQDIKYTKNSRGFFFNMNSIPNDILIEIKEMLENFNKHRVNIILDN
jgi:hypothetical protein